MRKKIFVPENIPMNDYVSCLECVHSCFNSASESFVCNRRNVEVNIYDSCQNAWSRAAVKNTNIVRW